MKKTKKFNNILKLVVLLGFIFIFALVLNNKFFIRTKANSIQPSLSDIILFDSLYSKNKSSSDYVVMLFRYGKTVDIEGYFDQSKLSSARTCTGVIIGKNWILTAAHCVKDVSAGDLGILVGFYDLKKQKIDNIKTLILRPLPNNIHPHNDYSVSQIKDGKVMAINDLALIKTTQTLSYSPVPLTSTVDYSLSGFASGWGAIGYDNSGAYVFADTLKVIELTISRPTAATYLTNSFYGTKFSDKILGTYKNDGFRISAGDSGSPLVVNDFRKGKSYLVGIDSSGIQFTDVSKYLKWIKDVSGVVPL